VEHNYEKLGIFYIGKEVDPNSGERTDNLLLYDSKDLTTHGVIIGMTGSGKTGLGIGILEEAAMDRIPVIAIDPKGDLTNLMLTFPNLSPADFRPWVNKDVAVQKGIDLDTFATQQAEQWRNGLDEWHQDGERIRRLREHADFTIYTPGSTAGMPVSVLRSFDAPPRELVDDLDAFRERIQSMVTGLLGLLGIEADPIRSREHILLSSILDHSWRKGQDLDLGALIQAIQQPPFSRLGVMELESVYPSKDRFGLAMQLNGLLASPGFQGWMDGDPLDIGAMLYTPAGKPRLSIFSIAHLSDAERMFFVTILLSAVLGWMRTQPGTSSLRALIYMDEVFGFFPPVANPPSKAPMLTLLKQARAFGVGMLLSTQNPVDLDYKGLGNTGTWFIGRLQTERDKARVLEALDGAMAGSNPIPRQDLDRMISGLGKRIFLMHNVHRAAPKAFMTRWVMSYMAGPMTLIQIRDLMDTIKAIKVSSGMGLETTAVVSGAPVAVPPVVAEMGGRNQPSDFNGGSRPILPQEIRQFFIPPFARGERMVYRPAFLGSYEVRYSSARHNVEETQSIQVIVDLEDGPIPFSLDRAQTIELPTDLLDTAPVEGVAFAPLPGEATQPRSYDRWGKELVRWIQGAHPITLYESKVRRMFSRPEEPEQEFRMRLADVGREARDTQLDKIRQKYESRFRTLQDRLRRAEQAVEKKTSKSRQAWLDTALSAASAVVGVSTASQKSSGGLLGALLGSSTRTSQAATTIRRAGRATQSRQDITQATETVEAIQAQIKDLELELEEELRKVEDTADAEEVLEEVVIRPNLNAISPRLTTLAWLPWGVDGSGEPVPLWR
jgi:hypothetical protein